MSDFNTAAQQIFNQNAANYVTSTVHAGGSDLERLVEIAAPQPDWLVLDVATGGGHTALRFVPHVRRVIASDFGIDMLNAARTNHRARQHTLWYTGADGERLPFVDAVFDLITCRVAVHHFPDPYRFALEAARTLKPGGLLVIQDHLNPDDARAADYIESFERLRDPSHIRAYNEAEWRGLLLDADLRVEHAERLTRSDGLISWSERVSNPPDVTEKLRVLLAQAPHAVADWLKPRHILSPDAEFDHVYLLIAGRKPA